MSSFELTRRHTISSLGIEVEEYVHSLTGALHYHLAAKDNHNAFMVAFRTVPMDSTGVAHILEHTVLCGSEKYPVRDPFFMMIRRSLSTFMNAFTSSDWTAYPFASQNRKDFFNLMDVYMDAVFFPTLHPLDFAQEGHRMEVVHPEQADSPLTFKGVVYNEMKGAMSSPTSVLYQKFTEAIFPTTTYHYNSGGDPQMIPELTYEALKAFHARHYHPSNAIFFTYGDIAAAEHHAHWQAQALERFTHRLPPVMVGNEQRFESPKRVEATYALDEPDTARKGHVVLGWLLGQNTDVRDVLRAHLLSMVLLDNSASPLRYVLETTELGSAPSPLCGLQDDTREMVFAAGLMGCETSDADQIEALILDSLERLVNEGIAHEHLQAMLHQLELAQREIGGDGYPFGLQLFLRALPAAVHGGDVVALLDIDQALAELRAELAKADFIPNLIDRWLLKNPHRVRLALAPDTQLSAANAASEQARLDAAAALMGQKERQQLIEQARALQARQEQKDDVNVLPKVGLEDIPTDLPHFTGNSSYVHQLKVTRAPAATNGLIYQQLVLEMPKVPASDVALLPLMTKAWTEVGVGKDDYLTTQMRQAAVTGGVSASMSVMSAIDDVSCAKARVVLSGKALARNREALASLMQDTLMNARFDELDRLQELVSMWRSRAEQSLTGRGHSLAMTAACAHLGPSAAWSHAQDGLLGVKRLKALDERLKQEDALVEFAQHLTQLRQAMTRAARQAVLVGEDDDLVATLKTLESLWPDLMTHTEIPADFTTEVPQPVTGGQAWVTSTQVHFCAQAHAAVPWSHPDAPVLSVLSGVLRNGYLHPQIREKGGAYGGGASYDANAGAFCFYSYRDPRLLETYQVFDDALSWLLSSQAKEEMVEEAILGVIGAMDKPGSPAGEAKKLFHLELLGKTHAKRMAWRRSLLSTKLADVRRVAQTYLSDESKRSRAVLTHEAGARQLADRLGFSVLEV